MKYLSLKEYREAKGLSVIAAAQEIGITRQHLYAIEKADAYASRRLAARIEQWANGAVKGESLLAPIC